jgi:methionyl-tRNA formyltransferase
LHQSPVKDFALLHNLPIHQPAKIKTPEAKELFASHGAEAAVVVAYGKILPSEFLNAYQHGCINVHFSLLPKYRGAAPVNWAIVNGEKETGVTTMKIVEELDAGPILLQNATEIGQTETAPELMSRLAEMGADLIGETLQKLPSLKPRDQSVDQATFAPILKREDGLIDWSMDAFAIERRVRGFQPWPNAHTTFGARRLTVWKSSPADASQFSADPGSIIEADGDNLLVLCGNKTVLRVHELQAEGARRMAAGDFLNGAHIRAGSRLGDKPG